MTGRDIKLYVFSCYIIQNTEISDFEKNVLSIFGSSYICEQTFSLTMWNKSDLTVWMTGCSSVHCNASI
jgi:hypothetical protein